MSYVEISCEIGYQLGEATKLAMPSTLDFVTRRLKHWDDARLGEGRRPDRGRITGRQNQGQLIMSRALLCVVAAVLSVSAQEPMLRVPVAFESTTSGVLCDVYESYRLAMELEEQAGKPIVFEAEHASKLSLHGAERLAHLPDAVGGVSVWQLKQVWLNFVTLTPGEYTAWYRCKARPGYGINGPFRAAISNGQILEPKVVPRRTDRQGCWMWLKGNRYKLNAGMHHFQVRANLVFYGACIDRVVWTRDEAFQPADDDVGPPETAVAAVTEGSATSGPIDLEGVRRWKRVSCRQVACGGRWRNTSSPRIWWRTSAIGLSCSSGCVTITPHPTPRRRCSIMSRSRSKSAS